MTRKEIIDGLKFTVDMFLFDPSTGETFTEPRNDMDKTTIDACKGAIELLEQTRWIPVSERLPENAKHKGAFCPKYYVMTDFGQTEGWYNPDVGCWYVLLWFMDARFETWNISLERGDVPKLVKNVPVTAWMPLPEPYKAESEEE